LVRARRNTQERSPLNRQLLRLMVYAVSVLGVGLVAVRFTVGDLGPNIVPLMLAFWFVLAGVIAATMLPGATPSAVGYLGACFFAWAVPPLRYEAVALSNVVLLGNAVWLLRRQRAK
ncbi:MAG: hypothetical protein JNK82_44890, partial [Myxococcaceae bacterium]|nr:hypothetical protein [Myxococcaceae bacterium]